MKIIVLNIIFIIRQFFPLLDLAERLKTGVDEKCVLLYGSCGVYVCVLLSSVLWGSFLQKGGHAFLSVSCWYDLGIAHPLYSHP